MEALRIVQLDIYALIVLAVMYFNIRFDDPADLRERYVPLMIIITFFGAAIEILTFVLDGMQGTTLMIIIHLLNTLLLTVTTVPAILWYLYIDFEIHREARKTLQLEKRFLILIFVSFIITVTSIFHGWIFTINEQNEYVRGPAFVYIVILNYSILIMILVKLFSHRKILDKRQLFPLSFFVIPALLGGTLQALVYGITSVWPGITISILVLFLFIKNYIIHTDYLTKLASRKTIHNAITDRIEEEVSFAAVMIDMDGFKQINDSFGHIEGNNALKNVAQILKQSFKKTDVIGRYAGDEFIVVFDCNDATQMEEIMSHLRENVKQFNETSNNLYDLKFSMGYDMYHPDMFRDYQYFIDYIDSLMYTKKEKRKRISEQDYE